MVSENCLTEPQGLPSAAEHHSADIAPEHMAAASAIRFKVDRLDQQSFLAIQHSRDIERRFQEIQPRTDRADVFIANELPKLRKYFLLILAVTLGDEWS